MYQGWQCVRRCWSWMGRSLWRSAKQSWKCRECQGPVRPLDSVCPTCGAYYPAKMPVSASVWATALASEVAIVLLRLS